MKKIHYPTGAVKSPMDLRNIPLSKVQPKVALPKSYSTDISMIPVLNQNALGACVGHAIATVMAYQNWKETGSYEYLSPRFIYALAKKIDGLPSEGTYPNIAAKVATDSGCAKNSDCKNDTMLSHSQYVDISPSASVLKSAKIFRSGGYGWPTITDEGLKQAIFQNGMICVSIECGNINSKTIKPGKTNNLHYIALYGYESKDGYTIFKYRNSWGPSWGSSGNGTFRSDESKGLLRDAIALVDIPNEVIEEARSGYKYFSAKEIVGLKPELVSLLDEARGRAGIPFKITSGYRDPAHNKEVGGVDDSAHMKGLAADIACTTDANRFKIIEAALAVGFKRIGVGKTFVHLDCDTSKSQKVVWLY